MHYKCIINVIGATVLKFKMKLNMFVVLKLGCEIKIYPYLKLVY